jgi:hypothetical protein
MQPRAMSNAALLHHVYSGGGTRATALLAGR